MGNRHVPHTVQFPGIGPVIGSVQFWNSLLTCTLSPLTV